MPSSTTSGGNGSASTTNTTNNNKRSRSAADPPASGHGRPSQSSPTAAAPPPHQTTATTPTLGDGSRLLRGESFALEFSNSKGKRSTSDQKRKALMLSTISAANARKALADSSAPSSSGGGSGGGPKGGGAADTATDGGQPTDEAATVSHPPPPAKKGPRVEAAKPTTTTEQSAAPTATAAATSSLQASSSSSGVINASATAKVAAKVANALTSGGVIASPADHLKALAQLQQQQQQHAAHSSHAASPSMKQILALRRAPTMTVKGPHLLPPRDFAQEYAEQLAILGGGGGSDSLPSRSSLISSPLSDTLNVNAAADGSSNNFAQVTEVSAANAPTTPKSTTITATTTKPTATALSTASQEMTSPSPTVNQRLYTIVLDLDETVVYARDGPLYARSHLRELLLCMHAYAEVVVWTAGEREYAKAVLEEINTDHVIRHLIYRHKKWFDEEDYTKDLKMLGRDLRFVLIVENTPDCVRVNPMNGIIVEDYEPANVAKDKKEEEAAEAAAAAAAAAAAKVAQSAAAAASDCNATDDGKPSASVLPAETADSDNANTNTVATTTSSAPSKAPPATDHTFKKLITLITDLGNSGNMPVPDFLSAYPLLRRQKVMGSNGEMIPIFYLSSRRARRMPVVVGVGSGSGGLDAVEGGAATTPLAAETTTTTNTNGAATGVKDTDGFKVAKGGGGKVVKINRDKKQPQ